VPYVTTPDLADCGPHEQEEIAFRVAWAAVKKRY
jgi:cation transport regulator ChaB